MSTHKVLGKEVSWNIRRYSGEQLSHAHEYVQILFAVQGRMELEAGGRAYFADTSCGMIIPAGVDHAFLAERDTRMVVIDVPELLSAKHLLRFAVTPSIRNGVNHLAVAPDLTQFLEARRISARRGIDLARLDTALDKSLHESWNPARMARLFYLSPQRFHMRLLELCGQTPAAYLRTRRLDAAQSMLRAGVLLETAALQVGYRSASALGFALRRDRNLSARQIRTA
jgi:AraC-like DNA-binding protein